MRMQPIAERLVVRGIMWGSDRKFLDVVCHPTFFITFNPRVEWYTSLWTLNASPPWNRCTFLSTQPPHTACPKPSAYPSETRMDIYVHKDIYDHPYGYICPYMSIRMDIYVHTDFPTAESWWLSTSGARDHVGLRPQVPRRGLQSHLPHTPCQNRSPPVGNPLQGYLAHKKHSTPLGLP